MTKVNKAILKKQNARRSFGEILQNLKKQKQMLEQVKMQKLQSGDKESKCLKQIKAIYQKIKYSSELIACTENKKIKTSRKGAM